MIMKIRSKLLKAKKLIIEYSKLYDSEFDYSKAEDANNNEYFYFHFKPRGGYSSLEDSIGILRDLRIRYVITLRSDWKSVIFVPINQKLNYIVHSLNEVYEIINYEQRFDPSIQTKTFQGTRRLY